MPKIKWVYKSFDELTAVELYAILKLRNEVFVVEQNCIYQDADGKDSKSFHLCGWDNNELAAYARLLPPGISYAEASIGRVVVCPKYRNTGIGKELMIFSKEKIYNSIKAKKIKIGAQFYLKRFYESLGFLQTSEPYLEDNILHIEMLLEKEF